MTPSHSLPEPAEDWALFLDVDGTLLEIAEHPDAVAVDAGLRGILSGLGVRFGGAVALVSGRSLSTLDRLFAPMTPTAAGLHGIERRDAAGNIHRHAVDPEDLARLREAVARFRAPEDPVVVEDKGLGIALHYRRAPAAERRCLAFVRNALPRLGGRFLLQRGKMVVEIRPRGPNKGDVVAAYCAEPPFSGRRPVFIGDDVTDEDAFAAANGAGGHAIRVGAPAPTAAGFHVGSVAALRRWLGALAVGYAARDRAVSGAAT